VADGVPMQVLIWLFPGAEALDCVGPFEVFTTASRVAGRREPAAAAPFEVSTVAAAAGPLRLRGGLVVQAEFMVADEPSVDVLIVPGGDVSAELGNRHNAAWISRQAQRAAVVASVCTGALLLARAGLLNDREATTHWEDIADMRRLFPAVRVVEGRRWIDTGSVVTSAGISAGIDMSLHLVGRLAGRELAQATARQMEYDWHRDDGSRR